MCGVVGVGPTAAVECGRAGGLVLLGVGIGASGADMVGMNWGWMSWDVCRV